MVDTNLKYTLALLKTDGVGDVIAKKLIMHCGTAEAVLKEKKQNLLKISGVGSVLANAIVNQQNLNRAEKELDFIIKNSIQVTSLTDANYPKNLQHCFDAPYLFFSKGNIDFNQQRIISIVGTRKITSYGKDFLKKFFNDIKEYNPIIVSGLAYGVDIYAHQLALEHNLQTVAVLAHGLDRIYPAIHKKEAEKMQANGGLLTDFWSGTKPDRENFVKRNRIVAGLSQATLVIESAEKGGSLITADLANSYNRDVFAVPGRVTDAFSMGCNNLIKTNRASVLTSVKDLAYILNWEKEETQQKSVQKQLFIDLTDEETKIYDYLLKEGKQQLDIIALHCNYPIHKTASLLLNLELKSVARPLPGKFFEAI